MGERQRKKSEVREGTQARKQVRQSPSKQLRARDENPETTVDVSSLKTHRAVLSDERFSHPANIGQKARVVSQLQRSYGNTFVQRLLGQVKARRDEEPGHEKLETDVAHRIAVEKGSGQPLAPHTRSRMEASFGRDFHDVRIHTDSQSQKLAEELGARAFASGKDIFLREGAHQPHSAKGQELLAHELAHVVQQDAAGKGGAPGIHHALEAEADAAGHAVVTGKGVRVNQAYHSPAVQLQKVETKEAPKAKEASLDMGTPLKNATEKFYNINEPLLANVHKHFKRLGKYASETVWDVRVPTGTKPTKKGGNMVIDPIPWKVHSVVVWLPKWKNLSSADDADKQEWARFMKCLRVHEQGHVDRIRDYVSKQIPKAWQSASASSVAKLKQKLQTLLNKILAQLKKDSKKYDSDTNHGATQDAVLKPPAKTP